MLFLSALELVRYGGHASVQPDQRQVWASIEEFLRHLEASVRGSVREERGTRDAYLAYQCWLERNTWVFNGESHHPRLVADRALRLAAEITGSIEATPTGLAGDIWGPHSALAASRTILVSWVPPPPGFLKVNFDGSVSADGSCGGVGFIIRDHDARLVAAGGRRIFDSSVMTAELRTAWEGVSYARRVLGAGHILLEGDSTTVIGWIREGGAQSRTGRCFMISVELWGRLSPTKPRTYIGRQTVQLIELLPSRLIIRETFLG
ncbi:uncharacterized protein LOC120111399 [Phoenix dactylifera]|uniref:Uncharacterized protein LOC120111399 n=1 Tax=Phoenix dactylifera TaxID=42345 RepID=A0A8B9AF27_PHODC|nr:uncharacterized protein LOC120111399 [Phoenix dactylifera]